MDRNIPVALAGKLRVARIASGQARPCGSTADASAWCWGLEYAGVLGDATSDQRTAPAPVDGSADCWGNNEVGAVGTAILGR